MDEATLEMLNKTYEQSEETRERLGRLFRACFYGDPGVGKTTLAMHICDVLGGKTLLIYTDSAWVAIDKFPEMAAKVKPIPYQGMSQINAICQAKAEGIEPWCNYSNLIWDTVARGTYNSSRELVKLKKFPKDQKDPDVAGWTHYNLIKDKLADTLGLLNKSEFNVIYNAHTKEPSENDREKKRYAIRPNLPWESYCLVAQEVALVGWLYKEKTGSVRKIQTEGTNTETAKSQIWTIEETVYNQTDIPTLIEKWKAGSR